LVELHFGTRSFRAKFYPPKYLPTNKILFWQEWGEYYWIRRHLKSSKKHYLLFTLKLSPFIKPEIDV
jgi:hypothetical protein